MRGPQRDPAAVERRAARRVRRAALWRSATLTRRLLAIILAVVMVCLIGVGACGQFGLWWGMIVTGCLCGVLSLLLGWE